MSAAKNLLVLHLIISMRDIACVPMSSLLKYEEYVIEHEISATQAKNSVLSIDLSNFPVPFGCQECSTAEINYCLSKHLIADHCCCDKRYHDELSYVPHTCYIGNTLCKPVIGDCIDYSRLRKCCCDRYVIQKWKEKSTGSHLTSNQRIIFMLYILSYLYFVNNF